MPSRSEQAASRGRGGEDDLNSGVRKDTHMTFPDSASGTSPASSVITSDAVAIAPNPGSRLLPATLPRLRRKAADQSLRTRLERALGTTFRRHLSEGDDRFDGWVAVVAGLEIGLPDPRALDDVRARVHNYERDMLRVLSLVSVGLIPVDLPHAHLFDPLQIAALVHDGFSPDGVEALMWIMDEALLEAGHGRHILTMGGQFEIVLGRGVKVTRSGLHVDKVPPETVVTLLHGRRASDLVDHPVLRGFVIDDVEVRKSGMIVRVSPS